MAAIADAKKPKRVRYVVTLYLLFRDCWRRGNIGRRGGGAAKLSVGLVGASPTIAILSWQCSYIRQWLE